MKSFSIKSQFHILGLLPALISLLVALAWFLYFWHQNAQTGLRADLQSKMALITAHTAKALQDGDRARVEAELDAFHTLPEMKGISIYDANGNPFATYLAEQANIHPPPSLKAAKNVFRTEGDYVQLQGRIMTGNQWLGSFWMMKQQPSSFEPVPILMALFSALGLACLIGFFLANRLQIQTFRPIYQMVGTMKKISLEGDFSKRVSIRTDGGPALLLNTFNDMLDDLEVLHFQEDEQRIRKRLNKLNDILREERNISQLAADICKFMCKHLGASFAAFYSREEDSKQYLKGKYGFPIPARLKRSYRTGEGLVGKVATQRTFLIQEDIPKTYFPKVPGLGRIVPETLMFFPFLHNGRLCGILELAFLNKSGSDVLEFLDRGSPSIGKAISQVTVSETMQVLLKNSQKPSWRAPMKGSHPSNDPKNTSNAETGNENAIHSKQGQNDTSKTSASLVDPEKNLLDVGKVQTSMNAILGLTTLLEREILPPRALRMVRLIRNATQSHLNSPQKESGDPAPKPGNDAPTEFDLSQVVDKLARFMDVAGGSKDLEMLIGPLPKSARFLSGDPTTLSRVLDILAGHAILLADSGEVVVTVQQQQTSADWEAVQLRFSVKEACQKVPGEKRETIFQAFSEQNSIGPHGDTHGGDWSICCRLVESMGGKLNLDIRANEGSEFYFDLWFPVTQNATSPMPKMTNLSILIADDNSKARDNMVEIALSLGWRPTAVDSGEKVLEALKNAPKPFEALLIDWKMPGLDGYETAREIIKSNPENPPLVLMANNHDAKKLRQRKEILQLGCILNKPVTASRLYHALLEAKSHLKEAWVKKACPKRGLRLEDLSILVVDDHEIIRDVAKEILEMEGAAVVCASDGDLAYSILMKYPQKFDIILMDIYMPHMDGIDGANCIRSTPALKNIPLVALASEAFPLGDSGALPAGINAFVSKPLETENLVGAVLELTGRHEEATTVKSPSAGPHIPKSYQAFTRELPALDTKLGLSLNNWDWALYEAILLKFAKRHFFYSIEVMDWLGKEEWEALEYETHNLRVTAKSIGSESIQNLTLAMLKAIEANDEHMVSELASSLDREIVNIAEVINQYFPTRKEPQENAAQELGMQDLIRELRQFTHKAISKNVACCQHLDVFREAMTRFPEDTEVPHLFKSIVNDMAYYDFEAVSTTSAALIERLEQMPDITPEKVSIYSYRKTTRNGDPADDFQDTI